MSEHTAEKDTRVPHTHGGTDAPECTPYGVQCPPACPCGCPRDMHIGEVGCPCALPGEPPCVTPPGSTDRGCVAILPLLGLAFVALGAWGAYSHHLQPWQYVGFGVLAMFALVCVGCCANDGTRERLDEDAPGVGER